MNEGWQRFQDFDEKKKLHLRKLKRRKEGLDRALVRCLTELHAEKLPLHEAKHVVLGVQARCMAWGSLPLSWRCVKNWESEKPSQPRRPFVQGLMESFATVAFALALAATGKEKVIWFAVSVGLRVGFAALLRPKELLGIKRCDVTLPGDTLGFSAV